ncbi:MAG: hypothetical protein ACLVJH_12555 [Faecalibacterium prausnitzii]
MKAAGITAAAAALARAALLLAVPQAALLQAARPLRSACLNRLPVITAQAVSRKCWVSVCQQPCSHRGDRR